MASIRILGWEATALHVMGTYYGDSTTGGVTREKVYGERK